MNEDALLLRLRTLEIETPSWGYGNSGTRFHVYPWPGAARTVHERIADAALVHRLTGCLPERGPAHPLGRGRRLRRASPIRRRRRRPDRRDQPESVRRRRVPARQPLPPGRGASGHGRSTTAVSASRSRSRSARRSISLWLADGTNYPGQDDLRGRHARLVEGSGRDLRAAATRDAAAVEYKFFEPGFYSTDLPDWGTAALVCRRLGPQAQVLVDTGHHPQGTNIEQIVAVLLADGLLGGFHFNNRKYADDDLIVGSIDPFELFRIMREIALGGADGVAFMIDQSHNVEGKIDAMIQSVMNIQTAYAKALLVDEERLAASAAGRRRARRPPDPARRLRDRRPAVARSTEAGARRRSRSRAGLPRRRLRERLAQERGTASVESAYEQT